MMRQIFIIIFWMSLLPLKAFAQSTGWEKYLFEAFKEGIVYYRDGRQFRVPLNYNLITGQFVFTDKGDNNQEKEFTEPGMIIAIEIDKRTFLPPTEGATEVLQTEPPFYVSYEGTVKREKSIAYGGTTQTASVDAYSQIRGIGQIGGSDGTTKTLVAINKIYKVKIGKRMKRFSTQKQFLKLFPLHKEVLEKQISASQVDFDDAHQVLLLYNYAWQLK